MNGIEILMFIILGVTQPCEQLFPSKVWKYDNKKVVVSRYDCGSRQIEVWSRWCEDGKGFWGRPYLMEDTVTGKGVYLNRFGELVAGDYVLQNDYYVPGCGV